MIWTFQKSEKYRRSMEEMTKKCSMLEAQISEMEVCCCGVGSYLFHHHDVRFTL